MKTLFFIILLLPLIAISQVEDDFSDGNFMDDPAWSGDISQFKISTSSAVPASMRPALQLNSSNADSSYLSLSTLWYDLAEWRFWIKQSFNSSSNNHTKVYLVSNSSNLEGPLDGYFLQVGGKEDSIILYRQSGTSVIPLMTGKISYAGNGTNVFRIKVTRDNFGNWKLFIDPTGGTNYSPEGFCIDTMISSGGYFGIVCKYSLSNSTNFYFDDFYIGNMQIDTIPPQILALSSENDSTVKIMFTESLASVPALDTGNYYLIEKSLHPMECTLDSIQRKNVTIYFQQKLSQGFTYNLIIKNIEDLEANEMAPDTVSFQFYIPQPYDIVINEIMPDPVPAISLPEYEFIELYNASGQEINLENWVIRMGSSEKTFGAVTMSPDSYLLLADVEAEPEFKDYGKYVGFPSFSLSNSGQDIELIDRQGKTISYISYDLSWYHDALTSEGGWTLEQIDPYAPCGGKINWSSSIDIAGGTPGSINSINGFTDEYPAPSRICQLGSNLIEVMFNQSMDSSSLATIFYYSVNQDIGQPVSALPVKPDFRSVTLGFQNPFVTGLIYDLFLSADLKNCKGRFLDTVMSVKFGITEKVDSNDVVINEILFNPLGDGKDFVEIYNRSSKIADISSLYLGSISQTPPNPPDTTLKKLTNECSLLLPGSYLLLTEDPEEIQDQYYTPFRNAFQEMESMPYFNNESGSVLLTDIRSNIIDEFHYHEDMHAPLLTYVEGVSLERIHFDRPSDDINNWQSAAEDAGFGTPGYENSQFVSFQIVDEMIALTEKVFSPDGDGHSDLLQISYHFPGPGWMGSLYIFDSQGNLIKNLVRNDLLGTDGFFTWDGTDDRNQLGVTGLYVILFEVFSTDGKTDTYRKACAMVR